jgi:hypothetical protein
MTDSSLALNVLDRRLAELVARDLNTRPGLIEKDWHVTRALGVLANCDHGAAVPAFGGGTSLSKGWGLIKRFSEDIDFKVAMPAFETRSKAKRDRSTYRKTIFGALSEAGFTLTGDVTRADENSFFAANFLYPTVFEAGSGLRPHLRVEMSLKAPALQAVTRPLASLIGMAQSKPPEVASFPCVDPVETAADKLSALAWRVQARRRGSEGDDPTIIRHVHDLAALKGRIDASDDFAGLVRQAMAEDEGRGGEAIASSDPAALFTDMLDRLTNDPLWAVEYQDYVHQVSFAAPNELIGFDEALNVLCDLVALIGDPSVHKPAQQASAGT